MLKSYPPKMQYHKSNAPKSLRLHCSRREQNIIWKKKKKRTGSKHWLSNFLCVISIKFSVYAFPAIFPEKPLIKPEVPQFPSLCLIEFYRWGHMQNPKRTTPKIWWKIVAFNHIRVEVYSKLKALNLDQSVSGIKNKRF